MPLNTIVLSRPNLLVGQRLSSTGINLPGRRQIGSTFGYRLNESDYLAGGVQFVYVMQVNVDLENAGHTIQFTDAEPPFYDLGVVTTIGPSAGVQRRDVIDSLSYQLVQYSRFITISRNEAARPLQLDLAARPRFLLSKTTTETFPVEGRVQPVNAIATPDRFSIPFQSVPILLSGSVDSDPVRSIQLGAAEVTSNLVPPQVEFGLSAQSGLLTPNGARGVRVGATVIYPEQSIDPFAIRVNYPDPGTPPVVRVNRRTNNMDVTDGSLSMLSRDVNGFYRPGSEFNSFGDPSQITSFGIWLRPGLTARATLTVLKCGESDAAERTGLTTYVPGVIPAP